MCYVGLPGHIKLGTTTGLLCEKWLQVATYNKNIWPIPISQRQKKAFSKQYSTVEIWVNKRASSSWALFLEFVCILTCRSSSYLLSYQSVENTQC